VLSIDPNGLCLVAVFLGLVSTVTLNCLSSVLKCLRSISGLLLGWQQGLGSVAVLAAHDSH